MPVSFYPIYVSRIIQSVKFLTAEHGSTAGVYSR
jgi:hypothetical protein